MTFFLRNGSTIRHSSEVDGKRYDTNTGNYSPKVYENNPLSGNLYFDYDPDPEDEGSEYIDTMFLPTDLKTLDPKAGTFVFVNGDGVKVTLTRRRETKFDYFSAL